MTRFSSLLGSGLVVAAGTRDEGRGTRGQVGSAYSAYAAEPTQEETASQEQPACGHC